jgi:ribosomal protein L37E
VSNCSGRECCSVKFIIENKARCDVPMSADNEPDITTVNAQRSSVSSNSYRSRRRCRVCGHVNITKTEYCSKCGYRLGAKRYLR